MRADLISRIVSASRFIVGLVITLALVACKTEKAADQPTILGVPPSTAYLGVEYYYNFGAYGGETILDYSLTNAPSWLALEDINNKARQGIIARGVPGLTGGQRGEQDLGTVRGINLVTTDGQMLGVQPFDVTVKYNPLSLESGAFTEGESQGVDDTRREHCAVPDLETSGKHSFTINEYNDDGTVSGTKEVTVTTRPVLVKVILDQPSVTRVAVGFELTSQYDPANCDTGFSAPHQRCDYSEANNGDAAIGQDIVALGSGSDTVLEDLDYLNYQLDASGVYSSGVVTFEPGITECYIRLEVADDSFPEPSETAQIRLTQVRSGLAGLGPNNGGAKATLSIDDNEPTVTFETTNGGIRDTINIGSVSEYVAVLSGERNGRVRAKLTDTEDSEARVGTDFFIERLEGDTWVESDELVFPPDVDEIPFRIRVAADSSSPDLDDQFILLGLDEIYQAGRENFARASQESLFRVNLNELTSALRLSDTEGFAATDFSIAHSGRAFVTGFDNLNRVLVKIYDQKGGLLQDIVISESLTAVNGLQPVINTVQRKVSEGSTKVDRFEFVVAYSTDAEVAGTTAQGGSDVIVTRYWFDEATNGGEYVANWTLRTGTSGDDFVRSVSINTDTGYVAVAGETDGSWPEQSRAGGIDSFLQRIDTELDGDSEVPKVAWTRQVGSSANDSVAGGSANSTSPLLFGSAQGAVNGEPVIGGTDAFFYRTSSATGAISVHQVGTSAAEPVANGVSVNNLLWLVGSTMGDYSVAANEDGERNLERTELNSEAGFLLAYSSSGLINRAFSINDDDDQSRERFQAISLFGGDVLVGGATNGQFATETTATGEQGILARVSLVEKKEGAEETPFRNEWRYQLPEGDSELLVLGNYRDDEITALARRGSDWLLLVFSPEGKLLSELN